MHKLALVSWMLISCAPTAEDERSPPAFVRFEGAPPPAAAAESRDITFAAIADLHLGAPHSEEKSQALLQTLAAAEGMPYPGGLGHVAALAGLVIAGDLTNWGAPQEWASFQRLYRAHDTPLQIFPVIGNHDKVHGLAIDDELNAAHAGRRVHAWDWGYLRVLALGESADDLALDQLAEELAVLERSRPLVLILHRPLAGPWSEHMPTPGQKRRLASLLEGRSVRAIVHGHHHRAEQYRWQHFDVVKPGALHQGAPLVTLVRVREQATTFATLDWQQRRFVDVRERPTPAVHEPAKPVHEPAPAPLAGEPLRELLDVEGKPLGTVMPPIGSRGPRPLVLAMHGAMGRPDWMCGGVRDVFGPDVFVVCPHPSSALHTVQSWGSGAQARQIVERALDAAEAAFPGRIDRTRLTYLGHSQGAMLLPGAYANGPPLLERRFSAVVLWEGLPKDSSQQLDVTLANLGASNVLMFSGQAGWRGKHDEAAQRLRSGGFVVEHLATDLGHFFSAEAVRLMQAPCRRLLRLPEEKG